jgi:hypothetical protein
VDFFRRPLPNDPETESNPAKRIKGNTKEPIPHHLPFTITFKYNEGYSNAIRQPLNIKEMTR